jgi:hypothetical protein
MLPTIDLDDEIRRVTDEIRDKGTDGRLSPETRAVQPMGTKRVPDQSLGVSRIAAQVPSA